MQPERFDRYIAVDWSANNRPKLGRDSIWVASARAGDGPVEAHNLATRSAAEAWLQADLVAAVAAGERVLVGLDFAFGYPAGFGAAVGLDDPTWRGVWTLLAGLVSDGASNASNRFEVGAELNRRLGPDAPFWGRPASQVIDDLPTHKTVTYRRLAEWRAAERALQAKGLRPHSAWKLAYAGSVGSQALLGIPMLHRLRHDPALAACTCVWPFEPLPAEGPVVVLAEAWPSAGPFAHAAGTCRDEQQVRALVERWRRDGTDLRAPADAAVRDEEGWVLGVEPPP